MNRVGIENIHISQSSGQLMQGTVSLRSIHGKFLSAQPDGRAEWNRDHASNWEHFQVELRHNGKIALKGAHGMYLSAQPDGSVQINRREAPPGGWEEFTVEDRGNNVVCLKSCHGKYLSAQQNGTAQWNRDHAPRGGWEDIQFMQQAAAGQQQPPTISASMPPYVIVAQAGSPEVNGNYEFMPGKHENRHFSTIAGHYQHTQNPEIFIAFQDCGTNHQRPEWNKWMIISKIGVLYAAHTGGKIGVPPREGVWENVDWGHPGAPGGKHPAPTVYHPHENAAKTQDPAPTVYRPPENAAKTQEEFEFVPVSEYDEVWNDSGSGAEQDVSVWRPRVPARCHLIGMTAKNGHSRPTFSTLVIRAGGRDIAPPERFDLVWWQERGKRRFWCWRPIPPAGYVSLGDVGTTSETPPSRKDVVCVSLACLSPNRQPLGSQIWNDRGGGAPKDAAFFAQPGGTGLFRCSDDSTHNKPHGEYPIPAGASTSPHPTQATNGIEILEAVPDKPVRFKINNPPSSNDAWVGIYHPSSSDQEIGKQKQQWEWLRDLDVNNASLPAKYEGNWSIRVFSDGGYRLHERKDFQVRAQTVASQPLDMMAEKPGRGRTRFAALLGIFLMLFGLPLLIVGSVSVGEDNLAMIIPGAILTGIGGFLAVGASIVLISWWAKSYAETGKPAPRWTWMGMVFAVLLLIPGITLLIIGAISGGSLHHEATSSARLLITDADGMGDQGFIIFIEGVPGDFDNDGIHDYCEIATVNATHSGPWVSDPWTSRAKQNDADQSRQVFELEIAHDGSGCDAQVWPEQMHGLVKLGRACYGCMAGYTDISASRNDASHPIPMWIQDGEKVVVATVLTIIGSIVTGIGSLSLVVLVIIRKAFKAKPTPAREDQKAPAIEVLKAIEGKPVRFRINDPPDSSSAWVGIYPFGAEDEDHGEEGERWKWLRDIDLSDASFPARSKGAVSIRVFSDGGHTVHSREEFDILPKKERWWED